MVAGVALANEVADLKLPHARILDYCLMIERHPDNVAAALYGGFIGTYLNELSEEDLKRKEIPLSEVLPEPAGGVDTGLQPPEPPMNIGHFKKFRWAKEIKCIAIIPNFEVSTAKAREVLPTSYSRADVVFNMQRIALLSTALGESPPDPDMIYEAMQDKIHQPYRKGLIPALPGILKSMTPKSHHGLLGICLSGAGPTILALATDNFDSIAEQIISQFAKENITCEWKLLEPAYEGTTVTVVDTEKQTNLEENGAGLTYADAGVSIEAGNELVNRIKPLVKSTRRPGADADIGGFGGALDLKAAGYDEAPILIQATDGVGTKLKIAFAMNKHDTVGIDVVAMNVNDLVVQGAEPLTFLDYFSCGKLDVDVAVSFVAGVAKGCIESNCALVGGETAEMPGMYAEGEYDVSGAATGAIKRGHKLLPVKDLMVEGDVLLGLASNGVHSNGFSLVRKILEKQKLDFKDAAPWNKSSSIGAELLTPTRIYVKSCLAVSNKGLVKGMAHITGGGLSENVPRMLPDSLAANIDVKGWSLPPVFAWLKKAGNVSAPELTRAWNTGIGMVLVVAQDKAKEARELLTASGETVYDLGELIPRTEEACVFHNLDMW